MSGRWSKYVCHLSAVSALLTVAYADVLRLTALPLLLTRRTRTSRIRPNSRSPRRLALSILSHPLRPFIHVLRRDLWTAAGDITQWKRSGGSRRRGGQLLVSVEGQEETDRQRKGKYVSILKVAPYNSLISTLCRLRAVIDNIIGYTISKP